MIVGSQRFLNNILPLRFVRVADLNLLIEHARFGKEVELLSGRASSEDIDLLVFYLIDVVVERK